jgi:hypothetical protein
MGDDMYQLRAIDGRRIINGHEIQVIAPGENGLCRIVDDASAVVHTGTYASCESWLRARAMLVHG